ncbi:hypothetical protein FACS189494_01040 [Spirochaetia bacterium]|nr:hypothetical protein FACS189494_01040 [Spirochaetia bacterium]
MAYYSSDKIEVIPGVTEADVLKAYEYVCGRVDSNHPEVTGKEVTTDDFIRVIEEGSKMLENCPELFQKINQDI